MPRYSIIIPSRNGIKYLPTCVGTIISQGYDDFELIISDDRSKDGTKEYLSSLNHPRITVYEPPHPMGMAEHWDWALTKATGEWLIFVGQDDGLQPYFFKLADVLTSLADKQKTRAIMSKRAYFFWPGCEDTYGNVRINYSASNNVSFHNCSFETLMSLLGKQSYFELPEMYTTSLFKRGLLEEVRRKQNGKVFVTHPQDANLAAIACRLERFYLMSGIPLGWVGSSPKSAGLAMSLVDKKEGMKTSSDKELSEVKAEYKRKVKSSALSYSVLAGNFSFSSCIIYLWQAMLQTRHLKKSCLDKIIYSRVFKIVMFGRVLNEMHISQVSNTKQYNDFIEILKINDCKFTIVAWSSKVRVPKIISKIVVLFRFRLKIILRKPNVRQVISVDYNSYAGDSLDVGLDKLSMQIKEMVDDSQLIQRISY